METWSVRLGVFRLLDQDPPVPDQMGSRRRRGCASPGRSVGRAEGDGLHYLGKTTRDVPGGQQIVLRDDKRVAHTLALRGGERPKFLPSLGPDGDRGLAPVQLAAKQRCVAGMTLRGVPCVPGPFRSSADPCRTQMPCHPTRAAALQVKVQEVG